jgi:hypothetical protein
MSSSVRSSAYAAGLAVKKMLPAAAAAAATTNSRGLSSFIAVTFIAIEKYVYHIKYNIVGQIVSFFPQKEIVP